MEYRIIEVAKNKIQISNNKIQTIFKSQIPIYKFNETFQKIKL